MRYLRLYGKEMPPKQEMAEYEELPLTERPMEPAISRNM